MRDTILTQKILKELIIYNPETGCFTWKRRDPKYVKTLNACGVWNSRFAGKQAGHLCRHSGYIGILVFWKSYPAHHLAWLYTYGHLPKEMDHINHDKTDNRLCNIREVTRTENMQNKGMYKSNKSGFCGVIWDKPHNSWKAYIKVKGKNLNLGRYKNINNAIKARKEANIKYGFHVNHGH